MLFLKKKIVKQYRLKVKVKVLSPPQFLRIANGSSCCPHALRHVYAYTKTYTQKESSKKKKKEASFILKLGCYTHRFYKVLFAASTFHWHSSTSIHTEQPASLIAALLLFSSHYQENCNELFYFPGIALPWAHTACLIESIFLDCLSIYLSLYIYIYFN